MKARWGQAVRLATAELLRPTHLACMAGPRALPPTPNLPACWGCRRKRRLRGVRASGGGTDVSLGRSAPAPCGGAEVLATLCCCTTAGAPSAACASTPLQAAVCSALQVAALEELRSSQGSQGTTSQPSTHTNWTRIGCSTRTSRPPWMSPALACLCTSPCPCRLQALRQERQRQPPG